MMERSSMHPQFASPIVLSHGGGGGGGGGGSSSRPSLGFPLGTALLIVVVFSLSGIFSCCYHWDKLRRTLNLDPHNDDLEQPSKPPSPTNTNMKKENEMVPVIIMPGDDVPKFIAMPTCPPTTEHHTILQQQPSPLVKPPLRIVVPLYV